MKKSIKVISTLLLAIMLVTSIAGTVLAVDPNTVLNGLNGNGNVQTNDLTNSSCWYCYSSNCIISYWY